MGATLTQKSLYGRDPPPNTSTFLPNPPALSGLPPRTLTYSTNNKEIMSRAVVFASDVKNKLQSSI